MSDFSKKIKLTNGLTVIYEKNDNANIVSINIGVRVGSVHEKDHESGICHLIEHMVFKGTKSYKPGEIATLVESHGGELNAYTSLDQTVYYINLPARHFNVGLKLIKEMAFDALMDPEELAREKEVVVEEINRGKDNPHRVLGEALFSRFFTKHNYRRPVIGTDELVRGFSADKVYNFYKKHYSPQNMILGICGNIDEDEMSEGLEELFRYEVNTPLTDHSLPKEPEKTKHEIVKCGMEIGATYFELAFPAPHITHKDVPALDILSHLLGESETSLLEQNTKEKDKLVHSIYSSCFTPRYTGIFMIGGQVEPNLLNKALESIKAQIEYVKNHLLEDEKIERAKLLARSHLIYEKQTCEGTARKWMTYETLVKDYEFDKKYIEEMNKLTPSHVLDVAQKYLDLSKSTLAILHPKKQKITVNKSLYKNASNKKKSYKSLKQKRGTNIYKLDNGIRVVLKENHRLPLISMRTASLGGLRYETAANNGINHLLSNVITRSTDNLSQIQLSEKCEWLAASLSSYTGRNSFGFSFTFLSEKKHQAVPILKDVMLCSAFDPDEIKSEKNLQLVSIKNRKDQLAQAAFRLILQELFKGHPYQLNTLGETKSVRSLKASTIKNYYDKILVPNNLVISAVGDFDSAHFLDQLNENFSGLKKRVFSKKKIKKPTKPKKIKKLFEHKNKMQSHIALGFLSTSLFDKDKFVLEVIHNILSGQGGRLFLNLRDQKSLAYTVTSTMISGMETGLFATYIGTEPSKVNIAIEEMLIELERIQTIPVSTDELERAKNYIIGNHEIDNQKNSSMAMQFALNEIFGMGLEEFYDYENKIARITQDDILRVAKKYINLDKYVMGVVGPK